MLYYADTKFTFFYNKGVFLGVNPQFITVPLQEEQDSMAIPRTTKEVLIPEKHNQSFAVRQGIPLRGFTRKKQQLSVYPNVA